MNTTIALASTAFCLVIASAPMHAQEPSSLAQARMEVAKALIGTWHGVEIGNEAAGKATISLTANTLHFQGTNEDEWYKATFTLSDTNPSQLVAKITECPRPDFVGKVAFAIFKFEQGKLTIAGRQPGVPDAPKNFQGDATTRAFVYTKAQRQ